MKKTDLFNNLFLKFNRDFYNKSTNICIIIADKIKYNFNVNTIFSIAFYRTKGSRREQVHCCAAHPLTGMTLKI